MVIYVNAEWVRFYVNVTNRINTHARTHGVTGFATYKSTIAYNLI